MPWVSSAEFPTPWYHAICALVEVGTTILPGNMGRILSLYNPNAPRVGLENDFEAVRLGIDPAPPSRLSCIFLCPTFDDALAFAATDTPKVCQWYEVEPVEHPERIFISDIRAWPQPSTTSSNRNAACNYWGSSVPSSHREILYPGPVRVTRTLPAMNALAAELADTHEGRERLRAVGLKV